MAEIRVEFEVKPLSRAELAAYFWKRSASIRAYCRCPATWLRLVALWVRIRVWGTAGL